jgi:hypothetical protein
MNRLMLVWVVVLLGIVRVGAVPPHAEPQGKEYTPIQKEHFEFAVPPVTSENDVVRSDEEEFGAAGPWEILLQAWTMPLGLSDRFPANGI